MENILITEGEPTFLQDNESGGNHRCIVNIRDSYGNRGSYEGECVLQDDKIVLSGKGRCVFTENSLFRGSYEGGFRNNKFEGSGRYVLADNSRYEGNFENSRTEGWGRYEFANDGYYEGHFKDGKFNGWGRREFLNGNFYEGNFENNMFEGLGKYVFLGDTTVEGYFKSGVINGLGKYELPKGLPYEEEKSKDGEFNGWAKRELVNNGSYEGYFRNDKFDGWGKRVFTNGDCHEGYFRNGEFDGWGKRVFADGTQQTGKWENGREEGVAESLSKGGKCRELLCHKGIVKSRSLMSAESYDENGEIVETGGKKRPLYMTKFVDNPKVARGRSSHYTDYHIYDDAGKLERTIRVDFNALNELANRGIASLDKLVTEDDEAILDATKGLEDSKKISTFEAAKKCLERAVVQYMKNYGRLRAGILDVGGDEEIVNLFQLTHIETLEQLNRTRFVDPGWNKASLESIYSGLRALLGALGINVLNLAEIRTDFITLSVSTTSLNHGVSIIINIKKIKELAIQQHRQLSDIKENVIVCFDSSRIVGRPEETKTNLGGITKCCRFANQRLQEHGVCWLYAAVATLVAYRNPALVRRVLAGKIQSYGLGEGVEQPGLLNEYEMKVLQLLQDVAARAGIALVDGHLISREVVRDEVRHRLEVFLEDQALTEALGERISIAMEGVEKESGVGFDEESKKNIIELYRGELSKKIRSIDPGTREEGRVEGMDGENLKYILVLERIRALQELEKRIYDYLMEPSPGMEALEKSMLESSAVEVSSVPSGEQVVPLEPTGGLDEKYASGAKDNPEQLTAKLAQSSGNLETATRALDHSYGENLSPSPGSGQF
ncbi:MAG: hypothetical protein LBU15_03950 [Rickettsiales bacterium]|jgi:hypothetical protein|nr:hypothetical protein [Rickettsiales bacterium]